MVSLRGAKLRWSRKRVSDYVAVLDKLAPENLVLAKNNQIGRGAENAPVGAMDFTEGWFRELLKLTADNQRRLSKSVSENSIRISI